MQRWIYYDYMGQYNPVCEDVGAITHVKPNWPIAQGSYGLIDYIIADGIKFCSDIKKAVLETGCILPFKALRVNPDRVVFMPLPTGVKHGDFVKIEPDTVYINVSGEIITPICTDPRVLYIAHRGFELIEKGPTDDLVSKWCEDIPTKQKALRWLIDNKKKADCIPFDCMLRIIQKQEEK